MAVSSLLASCSPPPSPDAQAPAERPVSPWNLTGPPPHLVAHYMPWFEVRPGPESPDPTWKHWKWESPGVRHDPAQRRPDGLRDIAATEYPLIGPYNSWDPAVMAYHLQTAKACGIQAFLVIWYGPGSATDQRIATLLAEAEKAGMKVALCYEEKINFPPYRHPKQRAEVAAGAKADLQYIVDAYGQHPAYLRRNGRPFIAQFNGWGTGSLGPRYLAAAEWRRILPELNPAPAYCRQNLEEAYHPPIEGAYLWWTPQSEPAQDFTQRAERLVHEGRLGFYMTMACPGFDDAGVDGWGGGRRFTPREDLSVFRRTWEQAWSGKPELIQLVTWNDFNEGTALEPTVEHGFRYLDALESWLSEKTGRPADPHDNRLPYLRYREAASPEAHAELPPPPSEARMP